MFLFCLFVCLFVCLFYCLVASRAIWKPFYRSLRFWVVLTMRKMGRPGTLKPTVPARSCINPIKNGPNSPNLPSKDLSIICLSLLCFWSLGFHQKRSRSAYIFSIRAFFLSMRLTGHLDVTWSTIARSLRHSGNLPPSGSEHSVHLTVTKRAKTSPEQSSSFPSWSDFAPFLKPFHFRFRLSRAFKTTMHCAHSRKEAVT